jgi:glycosyltransferase involved in cell wall biosynthesis
VEPYLRKCIDSILDQTFKDFELLLIDDGSTDNSGKICDEYSARDTRIKILHQKNKGLSAARNIGIETSKGRYLSFIDSDDYIAPSMIETLYLNAVNYSADISECGYKSVFKDREIVCEFGRGTESGEGNYLVEKYINADIFYGVVTKLFKRELFENIRFAVGRVFEEVRMTLYFCVRPLTYVRTESPLYYYLQRDGSLIRSGMSSLLAREYIYVLMDQKKIINDYVTDYGLKKRLERRIMEKSVPVYLGLALSDSKTIRNIYAMLYERGMKFGIFQSILSDSVSFRNKVSYTLSKLGVKSIARILREVYLV